MKKNLLYGALVAVLAMSLVGCAKVQLTCDYGKALYEIVTDSELSTDDKCEISKSLWEGYVDALCAKAEAVEAEAFDTVEVADEEAVVVEAEPEYFYDEEEEYYDETPEGWYDDAYDPSWDE